ncbi:MAG TPA: hypothetical protein VL175_08430 [Pirellulales bacterium]|nr:hypothetical protein [Pirellulales bacterium]
MRLISVLPMLALVVCSACASTAPTATPAQLRTFGRGLEECDKLVLNFYALREGLQIDGPELTEIVKAMSPDNLAPWGNYSKFGIYGPMTFYAKGRAICVMEYCVDSIVGRDEGGDVVYVKLKSDTILPVLKRFGIQTEPPSV